MDRFGLGDYWKMYKARGIRMPISYLLHAQLFDWVRGTDTYNWVQKKDFDGGLSEEVHGQVYMVSWTKEVRQAFAFLHQRFGAALGEHVFVDIGCGKGKVCLIWAMKCAAAGLRPKIVGIDHSAYLIDIARANQKKIRAARDVEFIQGDVRDLDYGAMGGKLIFYLYNPFDAAMLKQFVDKIRGLEHLIVYVHPDAIEVLHAAGYETVMTKAGWHHADTFVILSPPRAGDLTESGRPL